MRNILITLLCLGSPFLLLAQNIRGKVVDAQTKAPIGFATVYFDGTTRGTTTDDKGNFELSVEGIPLPASFVISHLNYNSYTTTIRSAEQYISAKLQSRQVSIQGVEVADKDQRQKNLEEFRRIFLGDNDWGREATIANEDVLLFSREFELAEVDQARRKINPNHLSSSLRDIEWAPDSSYFRYKKALSFKIDARAPLQIDLPDLGYKLIVDLVSCELDYKTNKYSYLGHFYFQPYEGEGGKIKRKHRKNRILAYYNSHQHFCRSLYENSLAKNGYKIFEKYRKPGQFEPQFHSFNIRPYLKYIEEEQLDIQNLKGRKLTIMYYSNKKGYPLDLRRKRNGYPVRSGIEVSADSCIIRADGTMADSMLYFSGMMAQKSVAALLPSDFFLPKK